MSKEQLPDILLKFWLEMDSYTKNLDGKEWQLMRDKAYTEAELAIHEYFQKGSKYS